MCARKDDKMQIGLELWSQENKRHLKEKGLPKELKKTDIITETQELFSSMAWKETNTINSHRIITYLKYPT